MISFGGLASGLDTNSIISQLMQLERIPINALEAQKSQKEDTLDLIGTFKGLVQALQEKADALRTTSSFLAFDVTASKEGIANFSASSSALAGTHTLEVQQLAKADIWAFDGVADPTVDLASGSSETLSFDVNGTNYSILLEQDKSSLNEIASEINSLAGDDVNANVVNVGTDASPSYQLVLTSATTGEDGRITNISSTISGLTIDGTGPDGMGEAQSSNNLSVGANAIAVIDGLTVQRTDNDFSDVLPGVSINVLSVTDAPITFSVAENLDEVKGQVQEFVDSYNEVIDFINKQNTFTPGDEDDEDDTGSSPLLFGDNILFTVRRTVESALFDVPLDVVTADTEGFSTLSLVGITKTNDGKLEIDETIFDDKLAENITAVMDLFVDTDGFDNGGATENTPEYFQDTTADSGLADTLYRAIDQMFGTFKVNDDLTLKSLFDAKTESINKSIERLTDQIDRKEVTLAAKEQQLIQRFAQLEELMASLNAQGASLTSVFTGLNPQ